MYFQATALVKPYFRLSTAVLLREILQYSLGSTAIFRWKDGAKTVMAESRTEEKREMKYVEVSVIKKKVNQCRPKATLVLPCLSITCFNGFFQQMNDTVVFRL